MQNLLREPLVHFLIMGAVAFAAYGWFRGPGVGDDRRIEVDAQQVEQLQRMFQAQWKRPPTRAELDGLIDSFVREEVLYREALAMGLDRDDTVIRRRLAQKIELLADDLATRAEPSPGELQQFLQENLERYQIPARASFAHVYFSTDRRGDDAEAAALEALEAIRGGSPPGEYGDPFMLESEYPSLTPREVADLFGSAFAEALFAIDPGGWKGPIASSYGLHLVHVRERTEPRAPELTEISGRVRTDLMSERRREANEALVESLKERYEIVVAGR